MQRRAKNKSTSLNRRRESDWLGFDSIPKGVKVFGIHVVDGGESLFSEVGYCQLTMHQRWIYDPLRIPKGHVKTFHQGIKILLQVLIEQNKFHLFSPIFVKYVIDLALTMKPPPSSSRPYCAEFRLQPRVQNLCRDFRWCSFVTLPPAVERTEHPSVRISHDSERVVTTIIRSWVLPNRLKYELFAT